MATTSKGIRYPLSSDHKRLWEHFQNMAEDASAHVPTLLTTPDGGFPVGVTGATTAITVTNRLTVASVTYDRLLIIDTHTFARYSQVQAIQAKLFVNSTLVGHHRKLVAAADVYESYTPGGQFVLPASTAGVVEVRFERIGGTGDYDVIATETLLQVSHRRA
jgi:hypothetical protein